MLLLTVPVGMLVSNTWDWCKNVFFFSSFLFVCFLIIILPLAIFSVCFSLNIIYLSLRLILINILAYTLQQKVYFRIFTLDTRR